ncbi:unnamed protein product [Peniophora sp. CBMAI 1063]|nr:unnamed protein product [Peniophora sp. CBMAI 1063]
MDTRAFNPPVEPGVRADRGIGPFSLGLGEEVPTPKHLRTPRISTGRQNRYTSPIQLSTTHPIFYPSTFLDLLQHFSFISIMFSSTRLYTFVCIALGVATHAAPTTSVESRSPDTYDLSGGVVGLLLGLEGEGYGGNSDEDTYILKRDLYDLTGGIGALFLGADGFDGEGGEASDEYILKRQLAQIGPVNVGGGLLTNLGIQQATHTGGVAIPGSSVDTDTVLNTRDLYDTTGGIGALLFGFPEGYAGEGDEDTYILKRQVPVSTDAISRLGSNMGLQHAVPLAEAGLSLGGAINGVSQRDLYDTTGGIGALIFGVEGYGGEAGEDEYILKRDVSEVEARSPDLYDLTGGIGALIFGAEGEGYGGGSDEDAYILKRQLERLGLGGLAGGAGSLPVGTGAATSGVDPSVATDILPNLNTNADLASSLGLGI